MIAHAEIAHVAQRMIRAAEAASLDSLSRELGAAERFASLEEERLELLGAIADDMRSTLARSAPEARLREDDLREALSPHLQLLRHLSESKPWVN